MKFIHVFACVLLFLCIGNPFAAVSMQAQVLRNPNVEQKIDSLIANMTFDEKAGQLSQYSGGFNDNATDNPAKSHYEELIREGKVGSLLNVHGVKTTHDLQRIAVEGSRLKIPLLFGLDVIHGYKTIFPIPLAEASSWNPGMVERDERIAAREASADGVNWTFAPMVDIARDPRWGRITEGSGEDPYLGSVMAAARVRGFQGANFDSAVSILACAKHFAAYGAAEGGRDYNTVDISERTLREIYLPPFHAAVRAGAGTLMSSFNEIAGVPSSANHHLLTDILRGEWGFNGFVVSDWTAINELHVHGIAANDAESASLALNAGVDMAMEGGLYQEYLPALVKEGKIPETVVNEAVRRVLREKFRLGLFDDPYRFGSRAREKLETLSAPFLASARDAARQSIVLLKNDNNILPLKKTIKTLAVIGPLASDARDPLGSWSALGDTSNVVTALQGIQRAVSKETKILYARGCDIVGSSKDGFSEAIAVAKKSDAVILFAGEASSMSGEAASRSSLDLPGIQGELVKAVVAVGKPVVLVLMNGRPLSISWEAEHVPAIVETWFLGVQTGNAIADVLFGNYNPAGKLPVTFPRAVGQVPIYYNHKNTGRPGNDTVHYTSRYIDLPSSPLFPFGYGLSYTKFEYGNLRLSAEEISPTDSLTVSVDVNNAGTRDGEEVAQLYIRDEYGSVTRPVEELKGFKKIFLKAGATKTVSFTLTPESLSMLNIKMEKVVEPGTFKVFVGTNSVDVKEASFKVVER
ncbi:MAG: beta-glucosidase BglX [Bacteroidota bacterium]|nr:beta-glucosidase BglX [Bacteroidota bacterium]